MSSKKKRSYLTWVSRREISAWIPSATWTFLLKRVSYRTVAVKGLGFYLDFTNQKMGDMTSFGAGWMQQKWRRIGLRRGPAVRRTAKELGHQVAIVNTCAATAIANSKQGTHTHTLTGSGEVGVKWALKGGQLAPPASLRHAISRRMCISVHL